jgi:hypothetical protein
MLAYLAVSPRNSYLRGRLRTVDLLIKTGYFVKKKNRASVLMATYLK